MGSRRAQGDRMAWQLVEGVLEDHAALPGPQFRVLVPLAHAAGVESRRARIPLATIRRRANCADSTARRALGALEAAGVIKRVGGHGRNHCQVWELIGVTPRWANGQAPPTIDGAASGSTADVGGAAGPPQSSTADFGEAPPISGPSTAGPGRRPTEDRTTTDRARLPGSWRPNTVCSVCGDPSHTAAIHDPRDSPAVALEGQLWPPGSHGAAAQQTTPMPPPVSGLCRECGGHHATAECPTLQPDAEQDRPRRNPRSRGPAPQRHGPAPWSGGPIVKNPAAAEAGAALARQLLDDRPTAPAEPERPLAQLDEDARRAVAARQADRARAERDAPGRAARAEESQGHAGIPEGSSPPGLPGAAAAEAIADAMAQRRDDLAARLGDDPGPPAPAAEDLPPW